MSNLTPSTTPGWDPVPELETSTLALGGPGGPMNSQAQALLDRTESIAQGTIPPGAAITGSEVASVSQGGGLVSLTLTKIAQWVLQTFQGFTNSSTTNAVARTIQNKLSDVISVKDFGAKGDGITNDDAAISTWLASLKSGQRGYIPAGTYIFTNPKLAPFLSNIAIVGDGAKQTTLMYTGTNTNTDLFVIGDGVNSYTGWSLSGFAINSTTVMTGGWGLRIKRMQNGSELFDIDVNNNTTLYNGVYLDNVNVCKYTRFNVSAKNEGLSMSGSATSDEGSDIFLDQGVVLFSAIGYHVGGGQGGVYFGNVLAFGNGVNYQIDNLLKAWKNREIFFSDLCVCDGNVNYGIWINDTLTGDSPIILNAAIGSAGLTSPGGIGDNVYVQSWPAGRITIGPGQLYNAVRHGINNGDATCIIDVSAERHVFNNAGWGIYSSVQAGNNIRFFGRAWANTLGNFSPLTNLGPTAITGATGWTSFATVLNKNGRCVIDGYISQTAGAITQYTTIATVPTEFIPAAATSIVLIYSGGSSSDGMIPGRINTNGTVEALQAVAGAANIYFSGYWDLY